jgi:predicted lipoprotein with Yx(FWY)xxD motif
MESRLPALAILSFLMFASACAPAPEGKPTPIGTHVISVTGPTATEVITATATDAAATGTPVRIEPRPATGTATDMAGSEKTLMINTQGELAPNLVDDRGRSLYVYMNDEPDSSLSACLDDCAVEWPPLTVSMTPVAGEGVDPGLIGTIDRPNRSAQATYNGWPLYYYNSDSIPGTTFGQGYNGVWFLISPEGKPIPR